MKQVHYVAEESRQGPVMAAGQPVELAAPGECGEGRAQAAYGITAEVPFAGEAGPLAEDNQGNHLGPGQGSPGAGSATGRGLGFAEITGHDAECREEGVRVHHSSASFFAGWKLTTGYGRLPHQMPSNASPTIHTRRLRERVRVRVKSC